MKIIGLSGSLRKGSFNSALLRAAVAAAPAEVTLEVGSIHGIPLYDGDLEAESGPPAPVRDLQNRLAEAGGLLLVTPEYNNSMPGVFKNVIDWLSRPASEIPRVFGDLPVALMGATPGPGGTILAQSAWLPVLRTLRMRPWFGGRILVSGAARVFNESGNLLDEKLRQQLQSFMAGFARFASQPRAR
jgi:NAD(P)H-dependent FMN reductase